MTFTVRLLPSELQFEVEKGQTILEAALNQQIPFPHRCQVGHVLHACAVKWKAM